MSSSGMLDVLVARIAPGFAFASTAANSARLASRFSKIASMIDVGARHAVAGDVGDEPVGRIADAARILQALGEELRRARHRRREPLGVLVLQRHREPAQRAPRRDVAAHRAGADDVHVRRLELAVLAERLQPLLQPEHADQVAPPSASSAATVIDAGSAGGRRQRVAVVLARTVRGSRTAPDSARGARASRPASPPARR